MSLKVNFLGLELKSPVIVASSGLTETVERMKLCEENGAGAVVLKSLFEDKISRKSPTPRFKLLRSNTFYSYEQASGWDGKRYAEEIKKAKKTLKIPVIASINAVTPGGWKKQCALIEKAGADAVEVNVSCPHGSITFRGADVEAQIYSAVKLVRNSVRIPVLVKMSTQHTLPVEVARNIEKIGVNGITAFNRLTGLDIDINTGKPVLHGGYAGHGGPWAIYNSLRWVSAIVPAVKLDISGSGGVFNSDDVIKYIMCGAKSVQVCTSIVLNGYGYIKKLNDGIESFMKEKGYNSIDEFRGSIKGKIKNTGQVDRRQRFYAEIDEKKCTSCGKCMNVCFYFAVEKKNKFGINRSKCAGCGLCVEVSPAKCISLKKV